MIEPHIYIEVLGIMFKEEMNACVSGMEFGLA